MKALVLPSVLLLLGLTSCKDESSKQSQSTKSDSKARTGPAATSAGKNRKAESDQSGFSGHFHSAEKLLRKHQVKSAVAELDEALKFDGTNPEALNLRGSCYVQIRDFDRALHDFNSAAKIAPENHEIKFNIAEVFFVTKKWSESLELFERLREVWTPTDHRLAGLIDFKIMLCQRSLGHTDEFNRLAEEHQSETDSPISYFSKMALSYSRNEVGEAEKHLEEATLKFSAPKELSPWKDTLIEYGWYHPQKK